MGVIVRDSTWNRGSFSLLSCKPALGSHSYWTCSIPDKVGTGQTPASTTPLMTAMGSHKWMSTRPLVLETVMEFQRWTQDTNPQPLRTAMESHIPLHVPPTPPQPSHHQPITRKINPRLPSLMSLDSSRVFLKASIISLNRPQSPRMTMVFLVLVQSSYSPPEVTDYTPPVV